jgi:hypothetical protein
MASVLAATGGAAVAFGQQNWQPVFLTPEENETLLAVGEQIIPGTTAAQSNRVIDLLLSIESPATQTNFRDALKPFKDAGFGHLAKAQQSAFLERASTGNDPSEHAFKYLKEWLADAYWTSKAGLKELGFDGQMAWPEFNPCPHPPAADAQ